MNPLLRAIAPSIIRELHGRRRSTSIDLGLGEPTLLPDPAPFRAATGWVAQNGCPYSPNPGFPELRAVIAGHYRLPGLAEAENVCVTVGSQEALYVAVKGVLDPARDEALVVTPAYPLYAKLCQMEGIAVREVALPAETGFRPAAEAVLAALTERTRLLILASPSNPTGRVWPRAELQRLCEGLGERDIYILSDEVYRELYYEEPPTSPAAWYRRTIVVGSLSKSCALTGLRLGWALMPRAVAPAILKAHQFVVSCASTYSQRVALEIFQDPARLAAHRPHYQAQREALLQALARHGLSFVAPEGAFYCLVKLEGEWAGDSMAAALALLDRQDVVAIPGAAFGAEGYLRISWVAPPVALEMGLGRLRAFLKSRP